MSWDLNKHAKFLSQCHWQIAISSPFSKEKSSDLKSFVLGDTTEAVLSLPPVSPLTGLPFQDVCQVDFYLTEEICVLREMNNDGVVSSPVSTKWHFDAIIKVDLYWLDELCPNRPPHQMYSLSSPRITTKWPAISSHLPSKTSTNSKSSVSQKIWTMTVNSLFPTVTNEWPFQDHFLSKTLLTLRVLSLEISTVTMQNLFPMCHQWMACHFKTYLEYKSTQRAVSQKTWTMLQKKHLPFQDHLPSINLLTWRALCVGRTVTIQPHFKV